VNILHAPELPVRVKGWNRHAASGRLESAGLQADTLGFQIVVIWRKIRVGLELSPESFGGLFPGCRAIRLALGKLIGRRDRGKLLLSHGNRGSFPALFFASAIVFGVAGRPAIGVGDIKKR